jgi:hypothetical protein
MMAHIVLDLFNDNYFQMYKSIMCMKNHWQRSPAR